MAHVHRPPAAAKTAWGDPAEGPWPVPPALILPHRLTSILALGLALVLLHGSIPQARAQTAKSATMPISLYPITASEIAPARDGNIAIQEELEAARKAHTVEAYQLFLQRHPDHPLSRTAQQELDQLRKSATQNGD